MRIKGIRKNEKFFSPARERKKKFSKKVVAIVVIYKERGVGWRANVSECVCVNVLCVCVCVWKEEGLLLNATFEIRVLFVCVSACVCVCVSPSSIFPFNALMRERK